MFNSPKPARVPLTSRSVVGARMEDYLFLAEVGAGGMSRVFKARYLVDDEIRAVKLLRPELVARADCRARMRLEARLLAAIQHPNVVAFREEKFLSGGLVFVAMEFLEGESLRASLRRKGRLSLEEVLVLGIQTAEGMTSVHRQNILHRDLSPDNLFLVAQGDSGNPAFAGGAGLGVKILDFGIADCASQPEIAELADSCPRGKREYAPPEQWSLPESPRVRLDARADIFSLGVSLYELMVGVRPFDSESLDRFLVEGAGKVPPMRSVDFLVHAPAEFEDLVLAMVAWNREDRPRSMAEVSAVLRSLY